MERRLLTSSPKATKLAHLRYYRLSITHVGMTVRKPTNLHKNANLVT